MKCIFEFLKISILIAFITINITSCSKGERESTEKKSDVKDKWGRSYTREEFIKNTHSAMAQIIRQNGYPGKEFDYADKITNCVYDKENEYLEKTYGNNIKEGENYKNAITDTMEGLFIHQCMSEMGIPVKY